MNGAPEKTDSASRGKRALGYLFALACLVWVFHDIHPRQLLSSIRITNAWLLAAAVVFDILTYVMQGVRWRLLLAPVGPLRTVKATQAIYVGLFTNEIVPLRFGELVRAYLAARWLNTGFGHVIPSMVVERFLDAIWLLAGVGIVAIIVPLPRDLVLAGDVLGVIVLIAMVAFVWVVVREERKMEHGLLKQPRSAPFSTISQFAKKIASGLKEIGFSPNFFVAAAVSSTLLIFQGLAVWCIMRACALPLDALAGFTVMVIVRLGTAIPNAPANVGSFQFFTVLALGLFGIDKPTAAAFSLLDFAVLTTPLWVIGLFALTSTGMSFAGIRSEITKLRG